MALPFTGPCAVGLGAGSSGTFRASPFAKAIAAGSSILVFLVTSGSASAATHTAPTDNYGNTYTLIGSFLNGLLNGRTSVYLAANVNGGSQLQVTATGSTVTWYGIVAWPLYGVHTYNGDFRSATATGSNVGSVTTVGTPVGAIGFGAISTNSNPFIVSPTMVGLKRMLHSEQFDNANGQDLYTHFAEVSAPFTATWAISGIPVNWGACAFSLSGPTVPARTAPSGLVQNLFSRTNIRHDNDDASEFEAFASAYGFAGWLSDSQVLNAEQRGTHPWSVRSRLYNFRLAVYLKNAGGATCTRTYTWRKNGIDDLLTITLSGVSSADGTLLTGTDLVNYVDLEPGDRITLHRTGSGGAVEFDITHWSVDSLNEGNKVSAAAMVNCETHNSLDYYGAPLTWKGDSTNTGFRQFRADSAGARSLLAFAGRITRYDIGFWQQSNLRTATYPFVWLKSSSPGASSGVVQDGSGGTPDTRLNFSGAELDKDRSFSLEFEIGDWLQIKQLAPTGPAFNTLFCVSVAIEADVDGEYGLSIDWASFLGGHLGATPRYAGVNKGTGPEAEDEALRIGPVTFGRMNVLLTNAVGPLTGPGSGKHLFYRLLRNSNTALEIDLADANVYGEITGSVPYVQGDAIVFEFVGSGAPADHAFLMALAMAGALVVTPETCVLDQPAVSCVGDPPPSLRCVAAHSPQSVRCAEAHTPPSVGLVGS